MAHKISIIIPTYNCADYIGDAIDSVSKQSCQDFEIIIVDDGSTDNTAKVLDKYKSNESVKYIFQENRGPGAARNKGMNLAEGEYLCFLDADDQLHPDSLKLRQGVLDSGEDIVMVFTDYGLKKTEDSYIEKYLNDNKFVKYFKDSFVYKKCNNDFIVFNNNFVDLFYSFSPHPIWTGTVMMKKSIIDSIGYFRTDISVGEDTDYWTRIAQRYKIGYIDKPTAVYNNYRSYLTKDVERYCLDRIKSLKTASSPTNSRKKVIHKNISETYFQLGYYCFYKKSIRRLAIKYFLLGLKYNCRNTMCIKCLIVSLLPHFLVSKIKLLMSSKTLPLCSRKRSRSEISPQ
jgi:glycosyltransferase involved in cell wall biosynthesis